VEFRDTDAELLKAYKDTFDYNELAKMAIDYSDGVIEAVEGVDGELLAYAEGKGKQVLKYPGEDYAQAYKDFLEKIGE
jgi:starch synthase